MLSHTRCALEDFDNQHDFERFAADVLNRLGYESVEPMAPGGGSDSGKDIRFTDSGAPGVAFVTLDKNIKSKFAKDLAKLPAGDGLIALFCTVTVAPSVKHDFTKQALEKGYLLEVFDIERLRSLLDSSLQDVRRRYLGIDDAIAARLRCEVVTLIRYPDGFPDTPTPPATVEALMADLLPRRLFELLLQFSDKDIQETPLIGSALTHHKASYYALRQEALALDEQVMTAIGKRVGVRFRQGWSIYYRYVIMRAVGSSKAEIIARGDFRNYSITWDDAERVFAELKAEGDLHARIVGVFEKNAAMSTALRPLVDA